MERWRSSWRTPYPSSEEKIRKIRETIDVYKEAYEGVLRSMEEERPRNVGEAMTLGILKGEVKYAIEALETWKEKLEEMIQTRTPEDVMEFLKLWVGFEKDSHNAYLKEVARKVERILEE